MAQGALVHVRADEALSLRLFASLVEAGAALTVCDAKGQTPLEYARDQNRASIVKVLLESAHHPQAPWRPEMEKELREAATGEAAASEAKNAKTEILMCLITPITRPK